MLDKGPNKAHVGGEQSWLAIFYVVLYYCS
jgi:hypothetical protein